MKLHLPTRLRAALLAVVTASVTMPTTAQAITNGAVYDYTYFQHATQVHANLGENSFEYETTEGEGGTSRRNYDFRDPASTDPTDNAFDSRKNDWTVTIDAYNFIPAKDLNTEDTCGALIISNGRQRVITDSDTLTLQEPNSFGIMLDRFGAVRLNTNGDEEDSIDNDIVLFHLDASWDKDDRDDNLTVSFRITLSWDADGGLYNIDGDKYGALTLQSAYLLSNDASHTVIEEIDSFYSGRVLLNNYEMPEDFFSIVNEDADVAESGGCFSVSGKGDTAATAAVTLLTPGAAPAWCINGNTSIKYLLEGRYKDETIKSNRAMAETERVQFMGNNSTIWLTEGEYTYKNPTWATLDPLGKTSHIGIGFGAYEGATIIVDESVLNSTVIASNATMNALGDGTVRLVVNTNAIESVELPDIIVPPVEEEEEEGADTTIPEDTTDDTLAGDGEGENGEGENGEEIPPAVEVVPVPDIASGERYIAFNQMGANTNIELEVIGSHGVTISLGGATIGNGNDTNTTRITRLDQDPDSENTSGALSVILHNSAGTRMTSYVGSITNLEGDLNFFGGEYVDIYNEDDEYVDTEILYSRIKAKDLTAAGSINVTGIVKATDAVTAGTHVNVYGGYLEVGDTNTPGTLTAPGQLNVGDNVESDAILIVNGTADIGGSVQVYGQASIDTLNTTGIVVHNTDNEDALLTADSITADYISRDLTVTTIVKEGDFETTESSYQNIHISYKPVDETSVVADEEENATRTPLLSGDVSIGNDGVKANTIAADTQIFIAAESTSGVSITNISGSDIQIGTDGQGNKTVVMANVCNSGGELKVNPNGGLGIIASAGTLTTDTLELPTGYSLSANKLIVEQGIVADDLVTTGKTTATGLILTKEPVAVASELDAEEESAPATRPYIQIDTLEADTLDIVSGSVIYADAISTTGGTTLGDNVSLINDAAEGVVNGTISTGDAAYIYGITNKGEMETGAGSELVNSTIANTYKTTGTTTLTNVSVENASFGGAAGDAFYSENVQKAMKFSGQITENENGTVTLNVTNVALDATNLQFTEEGKEYNYTLLSANGDNTYSIASNLEELIYVPAYTWANIVSDGKTISVSGVYDETLYKQELVADSKNRANTMAALEVNATVEGSAAELLHNKLGDVMHTSLKSRQELLDAISGASLSTLADSQRRGVQDVQSSLRNRIIQMGGSHDEESMGIQAWAQADSSLTSSDSGDEAVGYDYNTWGATVGANVDLSENVVVGMSFSAAYGELDVDSADKATGNNDAYYVNFFTRHQTGRWTQLLILTVGSNDMDLTRNVGPLTASGSTSGSSYSAYYELGYTLGLTEDFTHVIQPMVSASITSAKVDGYKESGTIGNAALDYDGGSYVYGTVGIGVRYQGVLFESVFERNGVLELRGQITQDFGDTTDEATVSMAGGKPNSVYGTDTSGTGFNIGAGLSIPVQMQTTIFADADMTIRTDYTGFRATVGFRYDF